jgi:hypothetical protein
MNPWGALVVALRGQPRPCQSRKRLSVLSLLKDRASGNCLPMVTCPWRQALVAAGRGPAAAWPVPVLVWALAVGQGRGEAGGRVVGQVAVVAPQPVP